MTTLIRFFLHEPIFSGVVLFCVLVVAGLILSDRAEKRRTKELLRAREAARLALKSGVDTRNPATVATSPNRTFRIFRWEFALVSIVVIAFVGPKFSEPAKVGAKIKQEATKQPSSAKANPAVTATPSNESELTAALVVSSTNSIAQNSGSSGAASRNSIFNFESEAEWEGLADSTQDEIRGDLRSGSTFNAPDPSRRGRFSRK